MTPERKREPSPERKRETSPERERETSPERGRETSPDRWREQLTDDGSWTLSHADLGEACHSSAGAWTQARDRYAVVVDEFLDLATTARPRGELRLLDIGTGLGFNLAAAWERSVARGVALHALTLECDPRVQRAARALAADGRAPSLRVAAVQSALDLNRASGEAALDGLRLRWRVGDARETLAALDRAERFDVVFLDPFSPRVAPDLWSFEFLTEVARRMAPSARLSTYSASLKVRARLAAAGLAVGPGPRVGRKASGTLASAGGPVPAFDPRTQRRLARATRSALAKGASEGADPTAASAAQALPTLSGTHNSGLARGSGQGQGLQSTATLDAAATDGGPRAPGSPQA